MKNATIAVLTPTYNRAGLLINLYHSLLEQKNKDFKWIIVDDGSTDNTGKTVDNFRREGLIQIEYYRKINGGKHTALNYGISRINSELIFIVDSDDILTKDAVEVVLNYHRRYAADNNICGYSFLRLFPNGEVNGNKFETDEKIGTYIEVRINGNDMMADKAEVYKTRCLKEYVFPEIPGEKFIGEDIVWIRMATKYKMVHINRGIYIGNYLEEGLTKNRRVNNIKSPYGCVLRASEFMKREINLLPRIKGCLQYIIYSLFAKKSVTIIMNNSNCKLLTFLFFPIGIIIYLWWRKQYLT